MDDDLREIGSRFRIAGAFVGAARIGSGHIHATYRADYAEGGERRRYVHQRLNTRVFTDPEGLMENLVRVLDHLREKLRARGAADLERRCLTLIPARDGRSFHVDARGRYWRTYRFVEGARTHDTATSVGLAFEVARAFGAFAEMLSDLTPASLRETIPHFHDLSRRRAALEAAADADAGGRARAAAPELAAARAGFEALGRAFSDPSLRDLPRRAVHNDCKLNNVLVGDETGEALCVIDLDTVMEGTLLCDFGDLVRSAGCRAPEDERDLSRVAPDPALFEALARGYLAGARPVLTERELRALPLAGPLLTLETAVRFLTDHLSGDVYFRVHRPDHNLERARAQLRLAERMLERVDEARECVERAARAP